MSLDVYLTVKEPINKSGTGVFIRKDGQNVELTIEEVKAKWPDAEVASQEYESNEVFSSNITHNLGKMADAARIYTALWRPEEAGYTTAGHLIKPLQDGLRRLKSSPNRYRKFNPENGWGSYEGLIDFVTEYLEACRQYPEAVIEVSR